MKITVSEELLLELFIKKWKVALADPLNGQKYRGRLIVDCLAEMSEKVIREVLKELRP